MNTHDIDIELPPLDRPQVPLIDADIDLMDIRRLADWCEKTAKAYARAAVEADRKRRQSEAEEVCAEAYQVVGSLLSDLGIFETEHAEKILDNLSQARMVHKDVLPWHSHDRRRRGEPANESQRVYLHDEGFPEYLDGVQCQYVIERGKPYPHGDTVAFVYEKEDAERIVAALNNEPSRGEPVKVPSDADILDLWTGDPTHSRPVMGKNKVIAFARALLARYGQLADPPKVPSVFPISEQFTVEPHGDGYAIYQGRDKTHHGLNLAHLTECTPEFAKHIESALNVISEPVKGQSEA